MRLKAAYYHPCANMLLMLHEIFGLGNRSINLSFIMDILLFKVIGIKTFYSSLPFSKSLGISCCSFSNMSNIEVESNDSGGDIILSITFAFN